MEEEKIEFYHSKGKLFIGSILAIVFAISGALTVYIASVDGSMFMIAVGLFIAVLFSVFFFSSVLKIFRGYPYITMTDAYIEFDSGTKSEATIYYTDIASIKVSKVNFQSTIEIVLYDEKGCFQQLSMHNKIRLCMNRVFNFSLFTFNAKAIRKEERSAMLETLDLIIQEKIERRRNVPIIETVEKQEVETDFMKKYDQTPPVDRTIDRSYFLKAYGYGFFIFALSFIFFYLLISQSNNYLFYIIVSFILYPFAKALIDWMFGFKLRHSINKQKGFTYYMDQLLFLMDALLFHVSFFVGPIGIVFLLIRYMCMHKRK